MIKTKTFPLAFLSSQVILSMDSYAGNEYIVKKGDSFTKIVERYAIDSPELSYSQMLALILKLNKKKNVSEFDRLRIGDSIKIPEKKQELDYLGNYQQKFPPYWNPSKWKVKKTTNKYVVKAGDTLSKMAKKMMPNLPLFGQGGSIEFILGMNKSIKDANKIFAGQELIVPSEKQISQYTQKNLKRQPSQKKGPKKAKNEVPPKAPKNPIMLNFNAPTIQKECQNDIQTLCYEMLNSKLLNSKNRVSTLSNLKHLLELSREFNHPEMEGFYLDLIALFIEDRSEKKFLNRLKAYFLKNSQENHLA